jgi:hypothetical protein
VLESQGSKTNEYLVLARECGIVGRGNEAPLLLGGTANLLDLVLGLAIPNELTVYFTMGLVLGKLSILDHPVSIWLQVDIPRHMAALAKVPQSIDNLIASSEHSRVGRDELGEDYRTPKHFLD